MLHKLDIAHFTISAATVVLVFYPTASVSPICTQIEHTDRLIDQVVYRLYGLTEEEIAVVEGAAVHEWGTTTSCRPALRPVRT